MNKNIKALHNTVLTALFAALIAVATAFIKFNTGINNGYLHFGDSFIYTAACILPLPYSCAAAFIGGGLADLLAGAAVWAPFTAVIKAVNVLVFRAVFKRARTERFAGLRSFAAALLSGVFTVLGYLLSEGLLYSFPTAVTSVPFSIIQAVGSLAVFMLLGKALDKIDFKRKIYRE
ncbi:MAG: TIGR04002 family protein [Clostridia bacterium]|nr:TIGR04002 family protein [Clostridia bacterium]